jgi:hypothetical protein
MLNYLIMTRKGTLFTPIQVTLSKVVSYQDHPSTKIEKLDFKRQLELPEFLAVYRHTAIDNRRVH